MGVERERERRNSRGHTPWVGRMKGTVPRDRIGTTSRVSRWDGACSERPQVLVEEEGSSAPCPGPLRLQVATPDRAAWEGPTDTLVNLLPELLLGLGWLSCNQEKQRERLTNVKGHWEWWTLIEEHCVKSGVPQTQGQGGLSGGLIPTPAPGSKQSERLRWSVLERGASTSEAGESMSRVAELTAEVGWLDVELEEWVLTLFDYWHGNVKR